MRSIDGECGRRKELVGSILPLGFLPLGEKAKRYCSLEVSPEVKPTTRHCNSEGRTLYEMIVCCVQALIEVWRVFACWALTQATDVWSAAPGGKVVGTKLRKDDFSVFSAFYFNSPAMWQEGTGPATTEDLTNAVHSWWPAPPSTQAALPPSRTMVTVACNIFLGTVCRPCPS